MAGSPNRAAAAEDKRKEHHRIMQADEEVDTRDSMKWMAFELGHGLVSKVRIINEILAPTRWHGTAS